MLIHLGWCHQHEMVLKNKGKVALRVSLVFSLLTNTNDFNTQSLKTAAHCTTHTNFYLPSKSGADPRSVCVAIVIVEAGCNDEKEEEEEEEGRRPCSCVFSLITSSYEGGG